MSDVGGVSVGGDHQYSPEEIDKYKEDYDKGYHLFKDSFNDYNQPNVEFHKKEQLKKVMDEALNVMNETACVALKEGKQKDEQQLTEDYAAFKNNPTPENQKKVADDLDSLGS